MDAANTQGQGASGPPRSRYATKVYIIVARDKTIIDAKLSATAARRIQDSHPGSAIRMLIATK